MATKMSVQHLQRLREELAIVQTQIKELQGKEAGLRAAISIVSDEPAPAEQAVAPHGRRSPIKDTVLRLAQIHAEHGVVAADIVRFAQAEGVSLDRNSVSSLLSKFKREGALEYDGKVYRPVRPFPREVKNVA
jgi:hypothetical protein